MKDFNTLAVSSGHPRKGVADMLMRHFVSVADRELLDTYLQSQMVAHELYRRFEWEDVEVLDTDLDQWSPEMKLGIHRVVGMLRHPRLVRGSRSWGHVG